jgi:small subunit ribosomal protein S1
VHISELAQHHVENPREIVAQGDNVRVLILEVDADRRRLSLSLKRVEDGMPVQPRPGAEAAPPTIDLSEDVFAETPAAEADVADEAAVADEPDVADEPAAEETAVADEPAVAEAEEVGPAPEAADEVVAEEPAEAEPSAASESEPAES